MGVSGGVIWKEEQLLFPATSGSFRRHLDRTSQLGFWYRVESNMSTFINGLSNIPTQRDTAPSYMACAFETAPQVILEHTPESLLPSERQHSNLARQCYSQGNRVAKFSK